MKFFDAILGQILRAIFTAIADVNQFASVMLSEFAVISSISSRFSPIMIWASSPGPGLPRSIGKVGIWPATVVSHSLQIMRFSTCRTILTDAGTCSSTWTTLSGAFRNNVPPQVGQLQGAA